WVFLPGPKRGGDAAPPWRHVIAALGGFAVFLPGDLWWFVAQSGTRPDQFPPFSLSRSLIRLAARFAGDLLGGLPLYVDGAASGLLALLLTLLLISLFVAVI